MQGWCVVVRAWCRGGGSSVGGRGQAGLPANFLSM